MSQCGRNLWAALLAGVACGLDLTVDLWTRRLKDTNGRERVFHGTNVVFKAPPYHPTLDTFDSALSFCDDDMALLQSMGLNSIRLSVRSPRRRHNSHPILPRAR